MTGPFIMHQWLYVTPFFFFFFLLFTHTNTHICIYIVWFTVPSSLAATHAASGTPLFSLRSPHQSQCSTKDVFLFTDFFYFFYVTYRVELIFTRGPIPLCLTQRTLFISVKINDPHCFDTLAQRQASWTIKGKVSTFISFLFLFLCGHSVGRVCMGGCAECYYFWIFGSFFHRCK